MKWLLVAVAATVSGCELDDTPQDHRVRLACEMGRMAEDKMSSDDAWAYCDRELELAKAYRNGSAK